MEPRIRLPIPKIAASATVVSETDDSYALKQFGAGFIVLQIIWLLCQPAYAQGDTGPPGLEGARRATDPVNCLPLSRGWTIISHF